MFLMATYTGPILGPLVPLFWFSGDVSLPYLVLFFFGGGG